MSKKENHMYDCICFITEDGCQCGGCGGDKTCSSECSHCSPTKLDNTRNAGKSTEVPGILGNEWEKEFDEYIELGWFTSSDKLIPQEIARFKMFINEKLSQQKAEISINISKLRQWLNEDRITDPNKMVTNEQIEMWLEVIK